MTTVYIAMGLAFAAAIFLAQFATWLEGVLDPSEPDDLMKSETR